MTVVDGQKSSLQSFYQQSWHPERLISFSYISWYTQIYHFPVPYLSFIYHIDISNHSWLLNHVESTSSESQSVRYISWCSPTWYLVSIHHAFCIPYITHYSFFTTINHTIHTLTNHIHTHTNSHTFIRRSKARAIDVSIRNRDNFTLFDRFSGSGSRLSPLTTPPCERTPNMTLSLQEILIVGSACEQAKFSELTMDMFRYVMDSALLRLCVLILMNRFKI